MPTTWLGLWYQRGMSSLLEITIDHIQTKGRCIDVLPIQQYYLFTDRINRCTRCLLFIERDTNLLQYRESECNDADDLSSINLCPNMIAPDAPLYTLHRNDSKPQSCPIQPPFLLLKLIKDGSICHRSSSSSYIGECINDYQFRLHLSSCSPYHQTLDLQLLCVATWIEGFHTYFVTRILSKQHHHNDNQYACFYYITKEKDISSSFSLSMATDGSCRDLNSRHMATVMTLSSINRYMVNESNISCIYPEEFQPYEWYSLNRTIQMFIRNNDIELNHIEQNEYNKRFHCLQSINSSYYRIRIFTNCDVNEKCLQIEKRTNNVLELIINNCHNNEYSKILTFIKKSNYSSSSCPTSIGHLLFESNFNHHHNHHRQLVLRKKIFHMSIGCDKKDKLIIYQIEKDIEYRSLTQMDTCIASWKSNDLSTIYLLAQSNYSNATYCLNFQMSDSIIIRNNSHTCSFNNNEDQTSISIYSAKLINPCSQSKQLLSNYILLLITILLYINHTR
ncbi:unnamed protein product [Rotaria sp. Silwood2]|nr:unnamed protein product [Rotaria sp. Silwood2]CAF3095660.1 unnamed protein product [Rotaria sp. Silwood2]CAF4012158.1 unnamed protein product [Rotaria sp. Silwood2]CAF4363177.1 unnamed protein product [Rotaria sp. Silwood2]